MRNGEYGLGIDVGDGVVSAAVCGVDGGAVALPLGEGRVAAAVGDDGRVGFVPADGTARTPHLVARVGDPVPVYAGGRAVPAAELVADAVQRVRALAAEQEGRPDAWTVVTVPPSWAGHRRADLARALTAAGVPRFSLVSSAVAAVCAHVAAGDLPAEPTVAVYDLGAGTLDTAVVGPTPDRLLEHLAVPPAPLPWGGRDVDDAVLAHVVDCLGTPGGDAAALRAACVRAKEALSAATAVRVGDGPVRLTREELDEVLLEPARRSAAALAATVAAAGLGPADVDAVVLTGGGARVPLVAEVVSGELGRPLVVGDEPALTSALGAATLAAEALAAEPPAVAGAPAAAPAPPPAAEEPAPALPQARGRRDRTRPAPGPVAAARPPRRAVRRSGRLGRGAVVTGLVLGLLLLGPAAAGLFDAVLAPAPAGREATAGADEGDVVARGSAAVGDGPSAARGGGTDDAGRGTAARPTGSPAGTSLAAALATAARSSAPSAPGSAAPTPDGAVRGTTSAPTSSARSDAGTPATSAPVPPSSSAPGTAAATPFPTTPRPVGGPPAGTPTGTARPPTEQPSTQEPPTQPPVQEPPTQQPPAQEPPAQPDPVDPPPAEPAPEPPAAEQPATEQPATEQPTTEQTPPDPAGDPAAGTPGATAGAL